MMRTLLCSCAVAVALLVTAGPGHSQSRYSANEPAVSLDRLTEDGLLLELRREGRVSLSGTFFATDSADLASNADDIIAKLANVMQANPEMRMAVIGHTDNTGNFGANISLSERRAQAVVDKLIAPPHAIAADRLVAVGVGPIDPVASNLSEDGRGLNRRVAFVLIDEPEADAAKADRWLRDAVTDCLIWTSGDDKPGEGAAWTGACQDGLASGRGTLIYWDAEGFEARYDGDVVAGRADGDGEVVWRNKDGELDRYRGTFSEGVPVGEGVYAGANGYLFEGELIDGLDHGRGRLTTPEGWVFRGEIDQGKMVGPALVYFETEDKEMYFGEAQDGVRQGVGTLVKPNEDTFHGKFDNDEPHGPGIFEGADGRTFIGLFAGGSPNGPGTVIDAEGTIYQGSFIDGKPEGQVLVTVSDGTQTTETWKDGSKVE